MEESERERYSKNKRTIKKRIEIRDRLDSYKGGDISRAIGRDKSSVIGGDISRAIGRDKSSTKSRIDIELNRDRRDRRDRNGNRVRGRKGRYRYAAVFFMIILVMVILENFIKLPVFPILDQGAPITQSSDDRSSNDRSSVPTIQPQDTMKNHFDRVTFNKEQWALVLVNQSNPLSPGYQPILQGVGNGFQFDYRAAQSLVDMMNAAKAVGLSPYICSAYRSENRQRRLFNNKVEDFRAKGYTSENAHIEAQTVVAYPRSSEHQLGLAVDIVSKSYQILDEKQADTPEMKWLIDNCSKFGFILRYPPDKKEITGVIFEPWHFRYVGKEAAEEIMSSGVCLEEYLQHDN